MFAGLGEFLYSMARLPPPLRVIVREKTGPDKCREPRVPHLSVLTGKSRSGCISAFRFARPRGNSRIVGKPELTILLVPTSGLPVIQPQSVPSPATMKQISRNRAFGPK